MNIYLALLPEAHEKHEGQGYIQRVSDLLTYSSRHFAVNNPDEADVILFLESNRFKTRHHFSCFSESALLRRYAHKSFTLNYCDSPVAFLPGLYVCMPRQSFDPNWIRAVPYPWPSPNPLLNSFSKNINSPTYTASFRGNISHPIRKDLLNVIKAYPELGPCQKIQSWFNHTDIEQLDYLREISNSHFVLCPRGIGTATYRLYETLQLGRIPVIISDEWVPPESINWSSCSLRISEQRIADIPVLLKSSLSRWTAMSQAATCVWSNFLCDEVLADYLFDQLHCLMHNVRPHLDWPYLYRLWHSHSFRLQNHWDFVSQVSRVYSRLAKRYL